jgi:pimeloyl-ACP methyl ester carboxylesterase
MRGPALFLFSPVLIGLVLYFSFAFFMVYAATQPEERKPFEQLPGDFGVTYEEVTFTPRGESLKLHGWLMRGQPDAPWLIFVHGINSQRTNSRAVELASRLIHEHGYNVLMFDLRAHGTSEGDRVTAGQRERHDALGAYDFALTQGAQPGRVGFVGQSYGAGIAIMAARLEPGIAAVVADSPFRSVEAKAASEVALRTPIPEWAASVFMPAAGLFGRWFYDIDLGQLSPERDVSHLAYPVLVVHGEADTRTPVSHGRAVHAQAPQGSELWTPPAVEHTKAFEAHPDEYMQRVASYLASRFGR